jgi:hypothetical protein
MHKNVVKKPEEKWLHGKSRLSLEDNVTMDLKRIQFKVMDCIHLPHDRDQGWALVKRVMILRQVHS